MEFRICNKDGNFEDTDKFPADAKRDTTTISSILSNEIVEIALVIARIKRYETIDEVGRGPHKRRK